MDLSNQISIMQNLSVNDTLNFTSTQETPTELRGIISDEVRDIFIFLNFVILCGTISFFGIILNIINIIVFAKLGFQESVNISFLFLSISDSGVLACLLWVSILYNPLFLEQHPTWDSSDIMYVTSGWPSIIFSRAGSWITVFITFERYLCIAMPLKVRRFITPRKTLIVNIFISILNVGACLPAFSVMRLVHTFDPDNNSTKYGLVHIENGKAIEGGAIIFSAVNQMASFFGVIVFTTGLVNTFARKSKWRNSISSSGNNEAFSNRGRKLVKMIILIATIFLICNTPMMATQIASSLIKEFSITGRYRNLLLVSGPFSFTFQSLNLTANIFVYVNLSSRFYDVLMGMLRGKAAKKGEKSHVKHHFG